VPILNLRRENSFMGRLNVGIEEVEGDAGRHQLKKGGRLFSPGGCRDSNLQEKGLLIKGPGGRGKKGGNSSKTQSPGYGDKSYHNQGTLHLNKRRLNSWEGQRKGIRKREGCFVYPATQLK